MIKSPKTEIPSDLVRTEYIEFNADFEQAFNSYLCSLAKQADHLSNTRFSDR